MKSTYEARATKFAHVLACLFAYCVTLGDFESAIDAYNACHSRKLNYAHGVSRIAIIRADYVIKFDFAPVGCFANGRAGNIESEQAVYARAVADDMAHLLAKTTVGEYAGKQFAIMPRINGIGDEDRCWWEHCTPDEYRWLSDNVNDLHDGNVGYRRGKVCVVDYAWDCGDEESCWSESSDSSVSSIFSGLKW